MFDLLFAFPDETYAEIMLEPFGLFSAQEGAGWDLSRCIVPIKITMLDGVSPDGFWLAASFEVIPEGLADYSQAVINRSLSGGKLSDFVLRTTWPIENVNSVAEISPVWAGSTYPLPGLPASDELPVFETDIS